MNSTSNETNFAGNIKQFVILNSVLAPIYLFFLLLPSLLLNGAIIVLFVKKKELRSPLNLLTGNQCCYGILSNLLNGFLVLIAYPISLSYGSCALELVMIATTIWTHFGVSTLNLAAFSVGIYFTLKYNNTSLKLTYRKVFIVVAVVWVYPALWAIGLAYSTRNISSLRCQLYTDDFVLLIPDSSAFQGELHQIMLYISRDFAVDMVSRTIVVIFCVASYRLFRSSTINPPEGLSRKMLLLPILMTIMISVVNFCSGVLLIGINNGYGGISIENFESCPLYYISTLFQLFVEYNALAYACLLIYLNQKLQSTFTGGIKAIWFWCRHPNHNTVVPQWFTVTIDLLQPINLSLVNPCKHFHW